MTNRVAVPLLALALFTAYNYYTTGVKPVTFSLVTRQQFLGIIAGFLSNRVALLLTEIRGEVRLEDFLSIVPGSFAEVYRESRKLDEIRDQKIRDNESRKLANGEEGESQYDEYGNPMDQQTLSTVVVICGPQAAGRISLTNALLKNGKCNDKIRKCKFLTTDRSAASYNPDKYNFITEDNLQKLRIEKKIVYEGEEKAFFGQEVAVYLSIDDLTKTTSASASALTSTSSVVTALPVVTNDVVTGSDKVAEQEKEKEQANGVFSFFSKDGKDGSSGKGKGKGKGALIPIALPCVLDGPPEMIEALLKYVKLVFSLTPSSILMMIFTHCLRAFIECLFFLFFCSFCLLICVHVCMLVCMFVWLFVRHNNVT